MPRPRIRTSHTAARTVAYAIATLVAAVLAVLPAREALAAWPDRTITIIVIFAPGGSNDLLGRLIAAELAPALGQNVIVENRVGANGNIGLTAGARAAPDGYTLVVASGVVLINPSVSKVAYDPAKDFAPVAYLGDSPNVILTRPASGIVSIPDLIAKAKAQPGKLTFASPGVGSISQLAVELLKLRTDIDLTHVPFSGAAPAAQAAIAGTTDLASVNVAGLIGHIQSARCARWCRPARIAGPICRTSRRSSRPAFPMRSSTPRRYSSLQPARRRRSWNGLPGRRAPSCRSLTCAIRCSRRALR